MLATYELPILMLVICIPWKLPRVIHTIPPCDTEFEKHAILRQLQRYSKVRPRAHLVGSGMSSLPTTQHLSLVPDRFPRLLLLCLLSSRFLLHLLPPLSLILPHRSLIRFPLLRLLRCLHPQCPSNHPPCSRTRFLRSLFRRRGRSQRACRGCGIGLSLCNAESRPVCALVPAVARRR